MDRVRDVNVNTEFGTGIPADHDPLPGPAGTFQGDAGGAQTLMPAWWCNMVTEEMRNLLIALGQSPVTQDVQQLARLFEQRQIPGITQMSIPRDVALGEVNIQTGWYACNGRCVTAFYYLTWSNTKNAIKNDDLLLELPFARAAGHAINGNIGPSSALRLDSGAIAYDVVHNPVDPFSVKVLALSGLADGSGGAPVAIGSISQDSEPRILFMWLTYWSSGRRNPAWPAVEWNAVGDQVRGAQVSCRYFGAQHGDTISVRDAANREVQTVAVSGLPSGTVTTAALAPGQYTLVHRNQRSLPIVVVSS